MLSSFAKRGAAAHATFPPLTASEHPDCYWPYSAMLAMDFDWAAIAARTSRRCPFSPHIQPTLRQCHNTRNLSAHNPHTSLFARSVRPSLAPFCVGSPSFLGRRWVKPLLRRGLPFLALLLSVDSPCSALVPPRPVPDFACYASSLIHRQLARPVAGSPSLALLPLPSCVGRCSRYCCLWCPLPCVCFAGGVCGSRALRLLKCRRHSPATLLRRRITLP